MPSPPPFLIPYCSVSQCREERRAFEAMPEDKLIEQLNTNYAGVMVAPVGVGRSTPEEEFLLFLIRNYQWLSADTTARSFSLLFSNSTKFSS